MFVTSVLDLHCERVMEVNAQSAEEWFGSLPYLGRMSAVTAESTLPEPGRLERAFTLFVMLGIHDPK